MKYFMICAAIIFPGFFLVKEYRMTTFSYENKILGQDKDGQKNLKYVIFTNVISGKKDDSKSSWRDIDILMDERAFNVANLITLYKTISNKYPDPPILFVSVFTSFDQIAAPDAPRISERPDDPEALKHHQASFIRRTDDLGETIRFTVNPPSKETKTIVIRESVK